MEKIAGFRCDADLKHMRISLDQNYADEATPSWKSSGKGGISTSLFPEPYVEKLTSTGRSSPPEPLLTLRCPGAKFVPPSRPSPPGLVRVR